MIYDCVLYNGEIECLEIRLFEMRRFHVKHIAVEADYTFTGKYKFPKMTVHSFKEYSLSRSYSLMPYFVRAADGVSGNAWDNEAKLRNHIKKALEKEKPYDDDIIIISDVDEIPRAEAIKEFIEKGYDFAALQMDVFWYKFNCLAERQTWTHPKIMKYSYLKDKMPNDVRGSGFSNIIENGGWHFSYLGDEDFIENKLASFSHLEYNIPPYNDKDYIKKQIESGVSLWGDSQFEFVPIDDTFPKYLLDNQNKFKSLIHEINIGKPLG